METQPNNSAFPEVTSEQDGNRVLAEIYSTGGLTIRAYMATKFMQGFISSFNTNNPEWCPKAPSIEYAAKLSVQSANALITELNKKL